jgi:hypothetical protein
LGPRCTINSADPWGSALTAASSSADSPSTSVSTTTADTVTGGIVRVVSPEAVCGAEVGLDGEPWLGGEAAESGRSAEPHWPQKLLPSGLS